MHYKVSFRQDGKHAYVFMQVIHKPVSTSCILTVFSSNTIEPAIEGIWVGRCIWSSSLPFNDHSGPINCDSIINQMKVAVGGGIFMIRNYIKLILLFGTGIGSM